MHPWACALAMLVTSSITAADDPSNSKPSKPCTIRSTTSGSYFDLNGLRIRAPASHDSEDEDDKKIKRVEDSTESYLVRGYDYGRNFTLNFCGPVVEKLEDVEDVSKSLWGNVSAYYMNGRETISMGQESSELVLRGRKLVLNYTGGSYCDKPHEKRKIIDDDDDNDDEDDDKGKKKHKGDDDENDDGRKNRHSNNREKRRKSTIISFICDNSPPAPQALPAVVSFIGASDDECTYFFEARSQAACATAQASEGGALGPGGVFGVIVLVALLVYFAGGYVYSRTVLNQRGWKQIPNYSMWASLFGFITDMFVILTSSCARLMPWRRGYNRISLGNGHTRGRDSGADAENRLIDQLDEEWDD